jgi:hypothetical protein
MRNFIPPAKTGCNTADVSSMQKETEIGFRMQKETEIGIRTQKEPEIVFETEIVHSK